MGQMEPVSAPVEEEAPDAAAPESPARTQAADEKEDDEEAMEHEESDPVIHEESDDAAQVQRRPIEICVEGGRRQRDPNTMTSSDTSKSFILLVSSCELS